MGITFGIKMLILWALMALAARLLFYRVDEKYAKTTADLLLAAICAFILSWSADIPNEKVIGTFVLVISGVMLFIRWLASSREDQRRRRGEAKVTIKPKRHNHWDKRP